MTDPEPTLWFLKSRIPGFLSRGEGISIRPKGDGDTNSRSIWIPHPGTRRRGFGISETPVPLRAVSSRRSPLLTQLIGATDHALNQIVRGHGWRFQPV